MRLKNSRFETFNDGLIEVCIIKDRSIVGNRLNNKIRYGNKVIGISRFYKAKIASDSVDKVISIPFVPAIQRGDVIILGEEQYKILLIQDKYDTQPQSRYLTLERINVLYSDKREG
ncbi:MAG TPA: hypothetical protein DC053_03800 [Lachnoclostridium sp.]|nr:hypothetical protein [Lachnoclostridium sp.]